ncbi:MAG: aminodeoxychorismate/anthranilate synthase component II [Bacteroidetes bacterium]|nr:MAG: aminodeoxychorismate/anthranilate synthase component II [Bacteroidota bacterium]
MQQKVLIIDNYDSFTYNLVYLVKKVSNVSPVVLRNDSEALNDIDEFTHIILSPGPGVPDEAGRLIEIIKKMAPSKPILGVCLGLQAIAEAFGGSLINLDTVYHGVSDTMKIIKLNESLYSGMTDIFTAARYHSWVVDKSNLPAELEINCIDDNGRIMGLSHRNLNVKGVQFHPESYLSEYGEKIIFNFLNKS